MGIDHSAYCMVGLPLEEMNTCFLENLVDEHGDLLEEYKGFNIQRSDYYLHLKNDDIFVGTYVCNITEAKEAMTKFEYEFGQEAILAAVPCTW